jgi:hypothetical protein
MDGVLSTLSPTYDKLFSARNNPEYIDFQHLLENGWEFYLYDGKLVLVKYEADRMLLHDAFGVLNKDE